MISCEVCNIRNSVLARLRLTDKDHPIFSIEFETSFGVNGIQVRAVISELRREGWDICSSKKGYYMASTPKEVREGLKDLEKRVNSLNKTIADWKKNSKVLLKFSNKESIFDEN